MITTSSLNFGDTDLNLSRIEIFKMITGDNVQFKKNNAWFLSPCTQTIACNHETNISVPTQLESTSKFSGKTVQIKEQT